MSDLFLQDQIDTNPATITNSGGQTGNEKDFLGGGQKVAELGKQIDWVFNHRRIEYLDAILKLQDHKSVAIRRKLAKGINKILSFSQDNQLKLQSWQARESDRDTFVLLDSALDRLRRSQFGDELEQSARVYSVTEAVTHIKNIISDKEYIIEGEIADPKDFGNSFYFGLKDTQDVRIDCRIFSFNLSRVRFPLNEGLSVRVTGKFHLNKQSRLVFDIDKIELTGEGELLRNLQLLDEQLAREGLFDEQNKQKPTQLPQKILLIASPNSAALKDFCKVLFERRSGVEVFLLPIKTQGVGAELEILDKLSQVNQISTEKQIDTIVMTRGGGSKDDLFVFNSERIVRAIHTLNKPIIVAIGHEQDFTLAEKAADLRASTPSNAAELVSLSDFQIQLFASNYLQSITNATTARTQSYQDWKNSRLWDIYQLISEQTSQAKKVTESINLPILNLVRQIRSQSHTYPSYTQQLLNDRIQSYKIEYHSCFDSIVFLVNSYLQATRAFFNLLDSKIVSLNPKKVLSLGYTIVRQDGEVTTSSCKLKKGKSLEIEFFDGKVQV